MKIPRLLANVVAVIVLTDQVTYWSMRAPVRVSQYLIDAYPWRLLHDVVARLRSAVGAYGPEQDDLLLIQCQIALSFAVALAVVWATNRWLVPAFRAKLRVQSTGKPAR